MPVSSHKNTVVGTLMVDMWEAQGVEVEALSLDNIVSVGSRACRPSYPLTSPEIKRLVLTVLAHHSHTLLV